MVVSPKLLTNGSGLIRFAYPQIPSHRIHKFRPNFLNSFKFSANPSINGRRVSCKEGTGYGTVLSASFHSQSSRFRNELPEEEEEPLWLSLLRDIIWSTRSLFSFMIEQPSQLKYIEWPSFTNTLKTATLSLFLVAVFIVALSSVDSALCYILAFFLRKSP